MKISNHYLKLFAEMLRKKLPKVLSKLSIRFRKAGSRIEIISAVSLSGNFVNFHFCKDIVWFTCFNEKNVHIDVCWFSRNINIPTRFSMDSFNNHCVFRIIISRVNRNINFIKVFIDQILKRWLADSQKMVGI